MPRRQGYLFLFLQNAKIVIEKVLPAVFNFFPIIIRRHQKPLAREWHVAILYYSTQLPQVLLLLSIFQYITFKASLSHPHSQAPTQKKLIWCD